MNCSQIFCTFAVETTSGCLILIVRRCELLSNFLYFCSRNNLESVLTLMMLVVNCSQIFCTFAVETTQLEMNELEKRCELLSNFLYFCSRNNKENGKLVHETVVNCSQIFCTFAVETTRFKLFIDGGSCELLSNFLYFCSRNNYTYQYMQPKKL